MGRLPSRLGITLGISLLYKWSDGAGDGGGEENKSEMGVAGDCGGDISLSMSCESCISKKTGNVIAADVA